MSAQARTAAAATSAGFSGAVLYAVSCTSRSQCTATGMASTRSGKNTKTLAERWNGTTWAVQSTPTPTSRTLQGGTLTGGVSCTSSTACVADGFSYSKKSTQLLGEGWNGHTWTAQPDATPVVTGESAGIACRWAKDCMAVGGSTLRDDLAEHWNGRKWSAVTTKHDGELIGVACPATGNCTAVGSNDGGKALAAHWNGKAWSDQSPASPHQLTFLARRVLPGYEGLRRGRHGRHSDRASANATWPRWPSSGPAVQWAVLTVPDPAPAGDASELNSVSCTSATNCMAVGDYHESGSTPPTPPWPSSGMAPPGRSSPRRAQRHSARSQSPSVSCPSAGAFCIAVGGSSATATGAVSPLTEVWNGSAWTVVTAPKLISRRARGPNREALTPPAPQ